MIHPLEGIKNILYMDIILVKL